MRTSFSRVNRIPAITTLSLLLAAALTGCASKNPLMEEPAAAAKPAETPAQATATVPPEAPIASGVTTTAPTGTQRFLGIFAPYRINIQQGNFVSREVVTQLKEGMQRPEGVTREQVRFALGTPLLTDMFHSDRWDYVFRLRKGTGETISSRVTVFFKDNRLVKIDGGVLPTEQEYLAYISGAAPGAAPAK